MENGRSASYLPGARKEIKPYMTGHGGQQREESIIVNSACSVGRIRQPLAGRCSSTSGGREASVSRRALVDPLRS